MTTGQQHEATFTDWVAEALPQAVGEAFGGAAAAVSVTAGPLADLIEQLGAGHHVHLEMQTAGQQPRSLLAVMPAADGVRLFDLEPVEEASFGDAETQLRLLSELTEGGEALVGALPRGGLAEGLTVAGASLEAAEGSAAAALSVIGAEASAACIVLGRPAGDPVTIVLAASPDLAVTLAADPGAATPNAAVSQATPPAPAQPEAAPLTFAPNAPTAAPAAAGPAVVAHPFTFSQLGAPAPAAPRQERNFDPILDVSLQVRVELGSTRMTVEEVLAVSPGSIIELDRLAGEPVDIVINDRLIARGEVVVVEENFGVRVTEIIAQRPRTAAVA
jgi:flagellar motor switch protein FliN